MVPLAAEAVFGSQCKRAIKHWLQTAAASGTIVIPFAGAQLARQALLQNRADHRSGQVWLDAQMQQPQQQFPQMLIPPGSYQPKRVRNNPKAPPSKASPLQQYAQLRASAAQMGINVVGPDGKALKKAALQAAIDAKKTPTSPPAQVATPAAPAIPSPPTAVPVIPPSVVVADTGSSAANPPNA